MSRSNFAGVALGTTSSIQVEREYCEELVREAPGLEHIVAQLDSGGKSPVFSAIVDLLLHERAQATQALMLYVQQLEGEIMRSKNEVQDLERALVAERSKPRYSTAAVSQLLKAIPDWSPLEHFAIQVRETLGDTPP